MRKKKKKEKRVRIDDKTDKVFLESETLVTNEEARKIKIPLN